MPELKTLGTKIGKIGIGHLAVAGLTKVLEERVQTGIIGNNTLMSGIIKLAEAIGISYVSDGNTWGQAVALGFGVDAIEDLANTVFSGTSGATANSLALI